MLEIASIGVAGLRAGEYMPPYVPRTTACGAVSAGVTEPTGHVFRVGRKRGPCWYAKYRLPDGRQVQKRIGPAWAERGRPPSGYFTKRTAEVWLRETLDAARRGALPGQRRTGVSFEQAAEEWLRFIAEDRERKPSTLYDYRSALQARLLTAFGPRAVESITPQDIEAWHRSLTRSAQRRATLTPRSSSPRVHRLRLGELLALCWRDVDFAGETIRVRGSWASGVLTTPKSGKVRSVALAPDVAGALAKLGRRENWVGHDDLVLAGEAGGYIDGSALRRRYEAALKAAGPAAAALPRPAAYLRDPDDRESRHPPGPGVDGARGYPDHDALPALRPARRRRAPGRGGVRGRIGPGRVGTS